MDRELARLPRQTGLAILDRRMKQNADHRIVFMKSSTYVLVLSAFCFLPFSSAQTATPAQAMALEQQGRLPEAIQAWHAVTERNPRDARAFASLGVVLARETQYKDAAAAYTRAITLNPRLPGIQLNLGLAEYKQGDFQAAIPPLKSALQQAPQNMQARILLGLSCYGANRFAEAAKYLEPAVRADPENTELHQVLAQSCLGAKQYSCAQQQFEQILKLNPDSAAAHMLLGQALDGMQRTPEAIAEFEVAAKVAPQEPSVHFGLGYLHWKVRRYDEAKVEFERELANDPNHAQALAYLGDVEMKKDNPEGALDLLRKAVQIRDDLRIAYLDMGVILAQQNRHPEAIAAFKRAESLDPTQPDAHLRLGRLYKATGDDVAAQKEFSKLRELHQKADDDIASKMSGSAARTPPAQP